MYNDDDKTIWCGNLHEKVTEEHLYELFLQAGPLERVKIPKDKDGRQKNYGFVTYTHAVSVPYAIKLFCGTALFDHTLLMRCRGKMAPLPPPIRANNLGPYMEYYAQTHNTKKFAEMTAKLQEDTDHTFQVPRPVHDRNNKPATASSQGNWAHRYHPYRYDKPHGHDDYKKRDKMPERERNNYDYYKGHSRHKHSGKRRDQKNHKMNHKHRRE